MKKTLKRLFITSVLTLPTSFGSDVPTPVPFGNISELGSNVCVQLDSVSTDPLDLLKTADYDQLFNAIFNRRTITLNKHDSLDAIRVNPNLSDFDKDVLMDLVVVFREPLRRYDLIENACVFRTTAEQFCRDGQKHNRHVTAAVNLYLLAIMNTDATIEDYVQTIYGFQELAKQYPEGTIKREELEDIADHLSNHMNIVFGESDTDYE